jgi:predicted DNA-binding transcriptional regulator YafY
MRADRLLAILLLLERGGRLTAGDLARRLEVSERTIFRDLEALGAAGVPVYAEPGRGGGVRLLEGYQTDLSGLSLNEAELVPLLGLSDVFAGIGVGSSLRQTETKLLMALGEDQRKRAEQSRRRLYVDLSRWWETAETVPHLPIVVEAVFAGRKLRVTYRRGDNASEVKRTLEPYGLVIQGGTWYLVAGAGKGEARIYRVSRIQSAKLLDERHEIPDTFELAVFWASRKEDFHMTRAGYRVVVRANERGVRALTRGRMRDTLADAHDFESGWTTLELSIETRGAAFERILGLGSDVIVLEPEELRLALAQTIVEMQDNYPDLP